MELTQEQIQCVENFLSYKKLDYIDVRFEVLDHIISDIEVLLAQGISFEDAFKQSTGKWHNDLEFTSSFLIGILYNRPKIVINKAVNLGKHWLIFSFIAVFLQAFLIGEKSTIFSFLSDNSFFFLTIGVGLAIINGYFYFKMRKLKTTFSFLFEKFIIPSLLLLFIAFLLPEISSFYVFLIFCNSFLGYKLYKEHQKIMIKCN
ncbi:hypothetical protein [Tenacibaculum dicentrarchi]|uniref:hypothetical protein n=1 Tax=Tenacibaculum dicentrarchi TaxID=669041 RepID=UPI00351893C9